MLLAPAPDNIASNIFLVLCLIGSLFSTDWFLLSVNLFAVNLCRVSFSSLEGKYSNLDSMLILSAFGLHIASEDISSDDFFARTANRTFSLIKKWGKFEDLFIKTGAFSTLLLSKCIFVDVAFHAFLRNEHSFVEDLVDGKSIAGLGLIV